MKRIKRIAMAVVRLAGRAVDSILITETPQSRQQHRMARVQGPGGAGRDPAAGVAADVANTQNSTTII